MYRLTAIRLVNWLHFTDSTIPIAGTTLLVGENGEGKSTILDALQVALVADLQQVKFNKATGTARSKRTLKSYILWGEKLDENDIVQRFRRSSATSYVLLQFIDDSDASASIDDGRPARGAQRVRRPFLCGFGAEAKAKGGEATRTHVVIPNATLNALPLIDQESRMALPLADFEAAVARNVGATRTQTPEVFLDALRFQIGNLPKSLYPSLLIKGLAFRPMQSVRDFVVEFLLEERPIETGRLVENLQHYEEMRRESARAAARLQLLDNLAAAGDVVAAHERQLSIAQFVYARAEVEEAVSEAGRHRATAARAQDSARSLEVLKQDIEREREIAQENATSALIAYARDDVAGQAEVLTAQITEQEGALAKLDRTVDTIHAVLRTQLTLLNGLTSEAVPATLRRDRAFSSVGSDKCILGAAPDAPIVRAMRQALQPKSGIGRETGAGWSDALERARDALSRLGHAMDERIDKLMQEGRALNDQATALAAGRSINYSRELDAFRFGLQTAAERHEIVLHRPVAPLCELVTDVDEEWRDTVEGWLGARRFDLIVDPSDYAAVRDWYDRRRDVCPTPDGQHIRLFGVSVVHIERVREERFGFAAEPLSDVVHSENALARSYLDYQLGGVQRCRSVAHLQSFKQAATATGFTYRGHRLDRVKTGPQANNILGAAARQAQRKRLDQQVAAIARELQGLQPTVKWISEKATLARRANDDWTIAADRISALHQREAIEALISRLKRDRAALDLSHVEALRERRDFTQERVKSLEGDWKKCVEDIAKAEALVTTETQAAQEAETRVADRRNDLAEAFPAPDYAPQWEEHRVRFAERLSEATASGDPVSVIVTNYRRRANAAFTDLKKARDAYSALQATYTQTYEALPAGSDTSVLPIRVEADRWRNTKLPEYQRQIEARIRDARVQLLDDVLAQLHSHFADLKKSLTSLNDALRVSAFNKDLYEFTSTPAKDLRPYYDLLLELAGYFNTGGMQTSAYELFEARADLLERLDTLLDALTRRRETPSSFSLEHLIDYRNYFDYDIKIVDGQLRTYTLSRNTGLASGGEVQTPTYVALFASFRQMYGGSSTLPANCGLFLVDEAFSLLDDKRIPALMSFVKETLGLQGVMAMPTGREAHFAEHAETMLLVSRDSQGYGRVDDAHDLTAALQSQQS